MDEHIKAYIDTLTYTNYGLREQIKLNNEIIQNLRNKCHHRYEIAEYIGDNECNFVCKFCGDSYIR